MELSSSAWIFGKGFSLFLRLLLPSDKAKKQRGCELVFVVLDLEMQRDPVSLLAHPATGNLRATSSLRVFVGE
jgi:hypothetical protein